MGRDSNRVRQFNLNRDYIDEEINKILGNLRDIENYIGQAISKKVLLRKAAKPAVDSLKSNTPVDTGDLKKSMEILPLNKSKNNIFVGPNYRKGGPHAHLVEYGYIARNGKRVEGNPFIFKSYNQSKVLVLSRLNLEIQKVITKAISGKK